MDGAGVAVPAPRLGHGLVPRHRSAEIYAGIKFTHGKKPAAFEFLSCFQFGLSVANTNPAGMSMRHMQRHSKTTDVLVLMTNVGGIAAQMDSPNAADDGTDYAAVITSTDGGAEEMHFYFDAAAVCPAPLASQISLDFCSHQRGLLSLYLLSSGLCCT
jgi:hypothetical protein